MNQEKMTNMNWTEEKRNQFKNLLKTIPCEDVALMTATVWCREFNLKFDEDDEHIARRWHRYFHTGSLETSSGRLHLYVKTDRENWMPVKQMSTMASSIWTCLDRNDSFMEFDAANLRCRMMAQSYVVAAKKIGIELKIVED